MSDSNLHSRLKVPKHKSAQDTEIRYFAPPPSAPKHRISSNHFYPRPSGRGRGTGREGGERRVLRLGNKLIEHKLRYTEYHALTAPLNSRQHGIADNVNRHARESTTASNRHGDGRPRRPSKTELPSSASARGSSVHGCL